MRLWYGSLAGALSLVAGLSTQSAYCQPAPAGAPAPPPPPAAGDAKATPNGSTAQLAPGALAPTKDAVKKKDDKDSSIDVTVHPDLDGGDSASRVHYGKRELDLRPRLRPGDIVEAVPGVFAVQHAGGGKANQYFIRGFDADHGTDLRIMVDDIPVNMVSHGHGQGFSDLHFLIPETVVGLDGYKGTYYAQFGDFATAGAINMHLAETLEESVGQYSIGQYGIMRGLAMVSPHLGDDWRAVIAAELYKDDGPFTNPEDLKRFNLYAKVTHDFSPRTTGSVTLMSYGSKWNGSGQIPARAVCGEGEEGNPPPEAYGAHCIDHFGNIDPTEGGDTQRHMGAVNLKTTWTDSDITAMAYVIGYRFTLYSNFTFFLEDPVHGDEIEQDDDRVHGGADLRYHKRIDWAGMKINTTIGAQVRVDRISNALWHDEARTRLNDKLKDDITESNIGMFAEADARINKYLRFVFGGRVDRIDADVDDLKPTGPNNSGIAGDMLFSPKAIAEVNPIPELDIFLDYGRGYHSNDARGAVFKSSPVDLMTVATGYEVGLRGRPLARAVKGSGSVFDLVLDASGFLQDLDSEIVWSGDEGGTEPSGATRRIGLELAGRFRYKNWIFGDLEATFVNPKYVHNAGNGDAIALAPTRTFVAGLSARPTFGNFTPFLAFRVKSIGDRPATQDATQIAQGFTTVDANAGLRWKWMEAGVDIQNLFNAVYREVNFSTTTRLPWEPNPVTGIHYSPGWPFTAIGRVAFYIK